MDKGQICPSGWQGPRPFFGMTEIRDADASKKTKLLTREVSVASPKENVRGEAQFHS